MGIKTKSALAAFFETNDKPTQAQFADLIDTMVAIPTAGATGVIVVESTASATSRAVGAFGAVFLAAGTTASAQSHIGGGTVGIEVLTAGTTASAKGQLGLGTSDSPTFANPQVTTIEVGHATDTTLSRSAAGTLAVEGVDLVKETDYQIHDITHTSDTALGTQASGGTQLGSTLTALTIPASGIVRLTIIEGEIDETGSSAAGRMAVAIDVGGTKVWGQADDATGTAVFATFNVNTGVASRLIRTGGAVASQFSAGMYIFDIAAHSFPTGAQDVKLYAGDRVDGTTGVVTVTGTTVTLRATVEIIAYT